MDSAWMHEVCGVCAHQRDLFDDDGHWFTGWCDVHGEPVGQDDSACAHHVLDAHKLRETQVPSPGYIAYCASCIYGHYGAENQTAKLAEEESEHMDALRAWQADPCDATRAHLAEETADVAVMLAEHAMAAGIGQIELRDIANRKVMRQLRRMDAERRAGGGGRDVRV